MSTKAQISLIQTGLRDLGYQPGLIDGLFGKKTNAAASAWALAGGASDRLAKDTRAAITLIQSGLRDLQYATGPIDGIYGSKTAAALQSWLSSRGAAWSAIYSPRTSSTIYQGAARYPVDEIIIHCSATRPDWMAGADFADQVAEIRRWHTDPKSKGGNSWVDIGYHHLISRGGKVLNGRAENIIGAHVEGHNQGTIGICLIGGAGSSEHDRFSDHFTDAQDVTLRQLILGISMRTRIIRISGHNQYAAKACPGFNVATWLREDF